MKADKVFTLLGASNYATHEREQNDYYATEPKMVEFLLEKEKFSPKIWECACGGGHIGKVLEKHGYEVVATDLVYRGYGKEESVDFLKTEIKDFDGDIITNPPYKVVLPFVEKAIDTVRGGNKVAMFLRIQFLEGKKRRAFFDKHPPKHIYVSSSRGKCALNGDFERYNKSNAMCFAWFVWEKGYQGEPTVRWIN